MIALAGVLGLVAFWYGKHKGRNDLIEDQLRARIGVNKTNEKIRQEVADTDSTTLYSELYKNSSSDWVLVCRDTETEQRNSALRQ